MIIKVAVYAVRRVADSVAIAVVSHIITPVVAHVVLVSFPFVSVCYFLRGVQTSAELVCCHCSNKADRCDDMAARRRIVFEMVVA